MRCHPPHVLRLFLGAALVSWAFAASGCARPETLADRQFSDLREAVSKMQAEHDKDDKRLDALEVAVAEEKEHRAEAGAAARGAAPAPAAAPAPVRVVQLGGGPDAEREDANDTSARPEIKVSGGGGGSVAMPSTTRSRSSRSGKSGSRMQIDDADPAGAARGDVAPPSVLDPEARKSYDAALAQVKAGQFDRGLEGLTAFLVRWPDHPLAENATYWRGEAYFSQSEYLRAAEQFEAVLARFGSGNKGADALYKLGLCHDRLGAKDRARQYWDRLKTEYPRSDAAKRIPKESR